MIHIKPQHSSAGAVYRGKFTEHANNVIVDRGVRNAHVRHEIKELAYSECHAILAHKELRDSVAVLAEEEQRVWVVVFDRLRHVDHINAILVVSKE